MQSSNASHLRARAVIFDLDGTLADTFALIVSCWNASVGRQTGRTYTDADVISRFGIPDSQMIRRELPGPGGDEAVEAYHAHYAQEHGNVVKPFDGIAELLAELRRRRVPLGLMTGKGRRSATITLDCLGWAETFSAVVTGDDVAEQKPHPAGPLAASQTLGVDPAHCAFVGDSPADIGAGKAAGMITVVAGWHPVYLDEVRRMEPDVWAQSPADVIKLLRGS
jgi:2-phosphoglycolate phosphatase